MDNIRGSISTSESARKLFTPGEAAEILGTSERHLRHLRSAYGLRAVLLGGKVRYRQSDLDDFIEQCAAE